MLSTLTNRNRKRRRQELRLHSLHLIESDNFEFCQESSIEGIQFVGLDLGNSTQSKFLHIFISKNTKIHYEPCLHRPLVLLAGHRYTALTVDRQVLEALVPLKTYLRGQLREFRRKFVT